MYVASLQQIYYSVSAEAPQKASQWLANSPADSVCANNTIPGYISSVDYGRQIFVIAETASKDYNFKNALSVAIKGHNPKLEGGYAKLVEDASIKAIVLGGSSANHAQVVSGDITKIRDVINSGASYNRANPAVPVSYTVKFLKDNSQVTTNSVAEYYDTKVETSREGKLVINHRGGYVAQYYVTWDEITGFNQDGTPKLQRKEWENNWQGRTSGASDLIILPANARNMNIKVREASGLVWNYWRTIVDERNLALVPKREVNIWGTTLHPKSEVKGVK